LNAKPKVAVVHPGLGFGGSEAATLWTIEALKRDYDVTFISLIGVDLERLNAYYGTALAPADFSFQRASLPVGLRNTAKFDALKGRFLLRYVRRAAPEFDVLISCYGPMDFGQPGLQMLADFSFVDEWRMELHPTFRTWKAWFYGDTLVRRAYMRLCDAIARINPQAWGQNVTLANSAWSAERMQKKFGMAARTLYPPVEGGYPEVPFAEREPGFVCLGRVSPEKCTHSVIEILRQVRARGQAVHLHIVGLIDDSAYGNKVRRLAEQHRDWVHLEGLVFGNRKKQILSTHRFGINGCASEAFGIAVAEMVLAGCIVFVPKGGGQVEIVSDPALVFENESDAASKVAAVLANAAEQERLRRHLRQGSGQFSAEGFQSQVQEVVKDFLKERSKA
jgi:glycosyltransferase involved in cell wall biosynthesis